MFQNLKKDKKRYSKTANLPIKASEMHKNAITQLQWDDLNFANSTNNKSMYKFPNVAIAPTIIK